MEDSSFLCSDNEEENDEDEDENDTNDATSNEINPTNDTEDEIDAIQNIEYSDTISKYYFWSNGGFNKNCFIEFDRSKISGNDGCNTFFGDTEYDGDNIIMIGPISQTKKLCIVPSKLDINRLSKNRFTLTKTQNQIVMTKQDNKDVILIFVKPVLVTVLKKDDSYVFNYDDRIYNIGCGESNNIEHNTLQQIVFYSSDPIQTIDGCMVDLMIV